MMLEEIPATCFPKWYLSKERTIRQNRSLNCQNEEVYKTCCGVAANKVVAAPELVLPEKIVKMKKYLEPAMVSLSTKLVSTNGKEGLCHGKEELMQTQGGHMGISCRGVQLPLCDLGMHRSVQICLENYALETLKVKGCFDTNVKFGGSEYFIAST